MEAFVIKVELENIINENKATYSNFENPTLAPGRNHPNSQAFEPNEVFWKPCLRETAISTSATFQLLKTEMGLHNRRLTNLSITIAHSFHQ